ncbi:MAG: PQQ-binding-like beta-propeller repeat protein [Acidobacteria bacterium]|nr:PQQ-binding-like beta-propeller repeat protein [Acidobacteriota bacterium]
MPGAASGDWVHYASDIRGTRYMPLDQINGTNFSKLEVVWRFSTANLGPRPEFNLQGTPLMVGGTLYATGGGGNRRAIVALDARTGELLWKHGLDEGGRADAAPRKLSGRGLSYWTDGRGEERIVYVSVGYRLVALNAKTGQPISSFGKDGVVDLKVGVMTHASGKPEQIDLEKGEIGLHATPTIVGDIVIVGSAFSEGLNYPRRSNSRGLVRAFDVRTGKQLWKFDPFPQPGELGYDTWEANSLTYVGNMGAWAQITADDEAGLVYLPIESPTQDIYGGNRPGANLFGESLVAVDLKTGRRKWHFQFTHHPIWDFDISSAPIVADIVVDGKAVKAVAVPTKQSMLYVFDRISGRPVWPIVERPVPQSSVPGEKTSPTQPFPTKPPAYARNFLAKSDVIDFTPELHAEALKVLQNYKWEETLFSPPVVGDVKGILGAVQIGNTLGGTNWPGGGYDPESRTVFVMASNAGVSSYSVMNRPDLGDGQYVSGVAGRQGGSALNVQNLPLVKPPYGVLAAIDLDKGELKWQVPHGETPDNVRNHPALKGLTIPRTGQNGSQGLLVTRTLVVIGDRQVTAPPDRARGAMLRAYDKQTGAQLGELLMPAGQTGSPMTYMVADRQFIVVAVGGPGAQAEYLAFALPEVAAKPSTDR